MHSKQLRQALHTHTAKARHSFRFNFVQVGRFYAFYGFYAFAKAYANMIGFLPLDFWYF